MNESYEDSESRPQTLNSKNDSETQLLYDGDPSAALETFFEIVAVALDGAWPHHNRHGRGGMDAASLLIRAQNVQCWKCNFSPAARY